MIKNSLTIWKFILLFVHAAFAEKSPAVYEPLILIQFFHLIFSAFLPLGFCIHVHRATAPH